MAETTKTVQKSTGPPLPALPDLHRQAFLIKNRKRLQHDGGVAWIRDGQLYDALKGGNYRLERGKPLSARLEGAGLEIMEKRTGELIRKTNSYRKL